MILVIDNYDSFTFNLVQALEAAGAILRVVRNDAVTAEDITAMAAAPTVELRGLLVSPGPSDPQHAGVSVAAVRAAAEADLPTLGVCLGMQAIVAAFGGVIMRAPVLVHGAASLVEHDGGGLFAGLESPIEAGRYHSLCASHESLPGDLRITARALDDGVIMGVRHARLPIEGIQFHPESLLTPRGPALLANFLRRCGEGTPAILEQATGFARRGLTLESAPSGYDEDAQDREDRQVGDPQDRPGLHLPIRGRRQDEGEQDEGQAAGQEDGQGIRDGAAKGR